MCGFVGFFDSRGLSGQAAAAVRRMSEAIRTRGPDSSGEWLDEAAGVALGHRRLAVVDLTPSGAQPMVSASGRFVIAFNGEIYNHQDLRSDLGEEGRAPAWRGGSDTETLLAGFDAWGVEETLIRATGMFALAVWDGRERTMYLARDRMGEKPLYFGWVRSGDASILLFGSELGALKAHPAFSAEIDRDALCLLMRHNYIPAPHSIYKGFGKLAPGHILTLPLGGAVGEAIPVDAVSAPYWSLENAITEGRRRPFDESPERVVDELEALLKTAIGGQMMADVPLGAFLSGGVDSSTVVALMGAQSSRPIKTFSIGFQEAGYDEAVHARAVAAHLGTDHTELYVTAREAMDVIPALPDIYNEPFADSSQIPTHLVSRLARSRVTVSLSGDAGDELFGGYNRYLTAAGIWNKIARVPRPARAFAATAIRAVPPSAWDRVGRVLPVAWAKSRLGDKLHKGADVLSRRSIEEVHMDFVSHWRDPAGLVIGGREPATRLTGDAPRLEGLNAVERMMALDTLSYLPDDILAKLDRAAMSVSLESRAPFLDHRVVEFAWRMPFDTKIRNGVGKWALREVLYRHVPRALIERPKMGFGVPIDAWLRGPLRDWAETLLSESRLRNEGYLDPAPIRRLWAEHLSERRNRAYLLWDVLMFQAWLEAV